jgi:hypothetical protein
MRSPTPGSNTSKPDIVIASKHGFWLVLDSTEYFLPFEKFPWFKGATESELRDVELLHGDHLYWPSLDVDLTLATIEEPEKYELVWN